VEQAWSSRGDELDDVGGETDQQDLHKTDGGASRRGWLGDITLSTPMKQASSRPLFVAECALPIVTAVGLQNQKP